VGATKQTAHTPTPWQYDEDALHVFVNGSGVEGDGAVICEVWPGFGSGESKEREANAAFIVRACNAHDDLVAALRGLVNADVDRLSDQAYAILLCDANCALAKAGAA
jgi:hypothetical protein